MAERIKFKLAFVENCLDLIFIIIFVQINAFLFDKKTDLIPRKKLVYLCLIGAL